MIRCLAVDDEAYASDIIAGYIRKTPGLELAGTTIDPFEALQMVQAGEVDLVFLDIQMPELSGIQFLKICGGRCKVILTTAYEEYALQGFELDVVDYLLKPIPYERFYKSVLKAGLALQNLPVAEAVPVSQTDFLFIKGDTKNKFHKVDFRDIRYIEGLKNYVSVYTDEQRFITYQTLHEFEKLLPVSDFMRIHKSYIVPFGQIKMVDGNTVFIKDQTIPIGETYREVFFKTIKKRK